ncbi:condensation domain-containing protein [Actinocrispum sp. NPDC049592]|uniref:non-ribosomal peptide synthetase n=1 Tax=Actinocrispum sp. NPDC049592 TaxID=3154835 RepID=UPI00342CA98D
MPEVDEARLAAVGQVIAEVLGREHVGPDDGFRALGGDSLRAVKAAGLLATSPGTEETLLEALLDGASTRALAELLTDEPPAVPDRATGTSMASGTLSHGEEMLWLGWRYHPDSPAYHVVNAFRVNGKLDLAALGTAVRAVVGRHPALRTRYEEDLPSATVVPVAADIAHVTARDWPEATRLATRAARAPLGVAAGRLLRVRTYQVTDDEWLLLIVAHHLAVDGWSMRLIFRDLAAGYAGEGTATGGDYREFAHRQRSLPDTAAQDWARRLTPVPDRIELAVTGRPPTRSLRGDVVSQRLSPQTVAALTELADRTGSSLFVVLLALLHVSLARRTGQWDALIATVAAARTQARDHETVGFFANTVPVRVTASPTDTIAEVVAGLREEWRYVLSHQDVPLQRLAALTRPVPDPAHAPLVDVALVLQQAGDGTLSLPGCDVRPQRISTGTAKFDLMAEAIPAADGGLELLWEYATDILDAAASAQIAEFYTHLAELVAADGDITVADAIRVSPAEAARIAEPGSADVFDQCVVEAFDAVRSLPGTAVHIGNEQVGFAALGAMRDQVAGALLAAGVKPGDVVAVRLPRSALSIAAMFGVWTVGGVLLMLDTRHPPDHQVRLIDACGPAAIVGPGGISADEILAAPAHPVTRVERAPGDPAWLVGTSGSTGTPKVTVGSHRGLRNRCGWERTTWPYEPGDVVAIRTPLGFVDAIAETVVPLIAGVPVVVVPEPSTWDIPGLLALLARHHVTRALVTPSLMRTILDTNGCVPSSLRMCKFSGEELEADLLDRARTALPGCRLVNLYGSAEVAGDATAVDVTDWVSAHVPLGRPIAGTEVRVLTASGEPVPPGVIGELVVTGAPVGLGYLSDVDNSGYSVVAGERAYRMGDLGRLAPDGHLYFAGRRDRQVKIRGCRVELDHVEAALRMVSGVREAVVWAQARPAGPRLMAVVAGTGLRADRVRDELRTSLPAYMVPSRVTVTDELAMTANGKLDRARAIADATRRPQLAATVLASEVERRIHAIWVEALDDETVGPADDFFAAGGDSLAANRMLAEVMRDTGTVLDLRAFLATPTIRGLAGLVEAMR